ncbi:MAG: hypothetical protein U0176_16230 [Bacteroidia bacterium]
MRQISDHTAQKLMTNLSLSVENAWALVQYAVRKHWYLMAGATAIGLILALFNARSAPNEFEVTASILVPTEEYIIEFDRLHSRSFAEKVAINYRLHRTIHDSKYGWIEMYDESPFDVVPIQFPSLLEDKDHSVKLLPNRQVRVAISTGQDSIILQGPDKSILNANGVKLQVSLTNFFDTRHLNAEFQFRWMSQEQATRDFVSRLQVSHLVEHPNLYRFFLTDEHPQMALDKMNAFLEIYLEAYRQHRYTPMLLRLQQVDAKIAVLEHQILKMGQSILPSGFSTLGFERVSMEQDLLLASIRSRIQKHLIDIKALQAYRQGKTTWEELRNAIVVDGGALTGDSLLSLPTIDSLLHSREDSLQKLESRLLSLNQSFKGAHQIRETWEGAWLSSRQDTVNFSYLLRKEYESALIERAEIELLSRKDVRMITVADPPYVTRSIGRSSRMRLFLALVLGGFVIGFSLAIILVAVSPTIRSLSQLRILLGDEAPWLILPADGQARRQTLTEIAMGNQSEKRLISVFGSGASEFGGLLLQQELSYDRTAAFIDFLQPSTEPSPWGIPAEVSANWWLSKAAEAALNSLTASHETVILALPAPSDVPEVVGMMTKTHQVFITLQNGSTTKGLLRGWMETMRKYELKPIFIWRNA